MPEPKQPASAGVPQAPDESAGLEAIRAFFEDERFATQAAKAYITEARTDEATCELDLEDFHYNAQDAVMGGALFTLADFAVAVASNVGHPPTVSVSNTIEFLAPARGRHLIAKARADRSGRHMGYYTADVCDELGTHVARMVAASFRKAP